jgi:2-amino-4-hydroxy-6-hydroxymethyldihydropteridine diphosphokinase
MPSYRVFEVDYVLGLGSNLGSRYANIEAALELVEARGVARITARSPLYDSAPLGPPQPRYLNGAARIASALSPRALLDALLAIEAELGRQRRERWGARTIDLDVLWSAQTFEDERLTVPHPRLTERWFALAPLLDVAPELAPEYAPWLARAGAPPAGEARASVPTVQRRALRDGVVFEARALDAADALAAALVACAAELRASKPGAAERCGRNALLVLRDACEAGRELEAIALRALEAAEHFPFTHVAVLALATGDYDARLIGDGSEASGRRPIAGVSIHFLGPGELRLAVTFSG